MVEQVAPPPSAPPTSTGRRRLGDLLLDAGTITEHELGVALREQSSEGGVRRRLGTVLRDLGFAEDLDIAIALAEQMNLELVTGAALHAAPSAAIQLVPRRVATRHDLIPLDFDRSAGELVVAIADPTNVVALDDLRALPGVDHVTLRVAGSGAITKARSVLYERGVADATVAEMSAELVEEEEDDDALDDADDEPVIRLVNALLADAIRSRASDVHVEPARDGMRVRYRVDGLLREVQHIPRQMTAAVTSRLKVMSSLDIAERRRPQDGRATVRVDGEEVDLRVSTMPSLHGEVTVLRLLRKGAERLDIDDLGFAEDQMQQYRNAIGRSQGLVVMTGPTGSGKTTTLYAGLGKLQDPTRNVITLEDPVEYQLDGVNQTPVNARIGMTFAAGLRAVLRQDPDVVMVGEIRDGETATLAVEASFTGHLVLSTLHTNDAPSTIARLVELGVERFLLGTTLSLVVAQRLARRICPDCAEPATATEDEIEQLALTAEELAAAELRRGRGCVECDSTGYRGRVGLYEVLRVTPRMRQLISDGGNELQVGALARAEGMRSLRADAITKALRGETTLDEVLRVTPEDSFRHDAAGAGADDDERATSTARRVGAIEVQRVVVLGEETAEEVLTEAPDDWEVTAVDDVDEALRRIAAEHPSLVVAEHDEGDPDRVERLLRRLRDEARDGRPVVVRSLTRMPQRRRIVLQELGVADIVVGNVPRDELWATLIATAI